MQRVVRINEGTMLFLCGVCSVKSNEGVNTTVVCSFSCIKILNEVLKQYICICMCILFSMLASCVCELRCLQCLMDSSWHVLCSFFYEVL